MAVNLQYATAKSAGKTADAAAAGLPAATANVLVHLVDPSTNVDVVPPIQQAHKAGAAQDVVTFRNVPYGTWQIIVQALGSDNSNLGFFVNPSVPVNSSTTSLTVNSSVTLTGLSVAPTTTTVNVGASGQFTATGTFSDKSQANMSAVATWSSSVPSVASVERGKVVGLAPGQSFIVALLADQNATGTLTVIQQGAPTPTPGASPTASPTLVGTQVCAQCHTSGPYANMYHAGDAVDGTSTSVTYMDLAAYGSIYNNYVSSVHYTPNGTQLTDAVTCEGCHGPGSQHYGVGPIPNYMPSVAQCGSCHNQAGNNIAAEDVIDITKYNATGHANGNSLPDKFFFQGGVGTAQAAIKPTETSASAPEWKDLGATQPVNQNEHIEECGVCHTPDQKVAHIQKGDVQDPPQIGCGSCHDSHAPAQKVRNFVTSRTGTSAAVDPWLVPNLKPVQVNNTGTAGVTAQFGAMNKVNGTWIRPRIYFNYKVGGSTAVADSFDGYTTQTNPANGDVLRLTTDRLCAACHTKGNYKYGVLAGGVALTTHETDVWTQWVNSAHGKKDLPPWSEFSLLDSGAGGHRPQYPIDMGAKPGQNGYPSGTTGRVAFDGRLNGGADNFACMQCHNGISAIDYMMGTVAGNAIGDTKQAHVVWGDSTVTCITCHDPHKNGASSTKNVRVPVFVAYNDEFKPQRAPTLNGQPTGNARGAVNKFQDLTPLPTNLGNNGVCLACHQGRESGWSAWNKSRWTRKGLGDNDTVAANFWYDPTKQDTAITANQGFLNDHYLAAGSLLFGRNSTEYRLDAGANNTPAAVVKQYSDGIPKHIEKGCVGCHMANIDDAAKLGGHSFKPNIKTCQDCHAGVQSFEDIIAPLDYDGNGTRGTVAEEIGTIAVISNTVTQGQAYSTGVGGTGLLGELNAALYDKYGMIYNPDSYPYFYKKAGGTYTGFTPRALKAAENLQKLVKTNGAIYVHNPFYASQILIDALNDLGITQGRGGAPTTFGRPTTAAGGTVHDARDYRTLTP